MSAVLDNLSAKVVAVRKGTLEWLLEKEKALVEKEAALISGRDKLLDKLLGAQPGRAVGRTRVIVRGQMAYTAPDKKEKIGDVGDWSWWGMLCVMCYAALSLYGISLCTSTLLLCSSLSPHTCLPELTYALPPCCAVL